MPDGEKFVEVNADKYGRVDHYEESAFTDIYPRRIGEISSVRSEVKTGEDGRPFTVYYFKDDDMSFDPNDYEIAGLVKRVSFQEGSELAGLGEEDGGTYYFEVNFNSNTNEFELITIWPYNDDRQLPGDSLVPKVGDKYILWHLRMPDEYYDIAETEFREAVDKYNEEHGLDIAVFKASTDHVWIEDNNADLFVGRRIRLESEEYFPEMGYRDSRITKITRRVNLPSQMDIEISDALSRSVKQKFTDDVSQARSYAQSIAKSVSLPDIIRTGDRTPPTDNNLFSALRVMRGFLNKDRGDRTDFPLSVGDKLTAEKSLQIGKDFAPGLAGGVGGKIYVAEDGSVAGELDTLTLRRSLDVPLLQYNRTDINVGNAWRAPGGGVIDYVTKINDYEYDVALRLEDGEIGAVAVDDICMGIFHFADIDNAPENYDGNDGNFHFAGFTTVYFKITAVYGERNENFRCILRPDWLGVPPCAEMTFVAYGNTSNPLRQQSRYSTLTYERYLRGVNDYNFGPSNIAAQFGDLSNLSILGTDMSGYSAYLDNVYFSGTLQKIKNAVPELRVWRNGDYLTASAGVTVHGELRVFHGVAQARWVATLESGWADVDAAFASRLDRIQTTDSFSIGITLADLFNGVEYIDMARLKLTATYDEKTYTTYVDLVNSEALQGEPGEKGETGDTGPEGAVWRVRLWSADMGMCYAGQTEVDGVKYLDCAYTLDADGQPSYFLCIVDTEQSAATKPGSTGGTCWLQMSDIGPVYASALFAPNARIHFLDGQEIVVSRDGEVIARLGTPDDSGVIMWSGGETSNEATYTLDSEGRARYGKKGGQRVEINPLSKAVEIYDASGARVAVLSGDASAVTATTAPRLYPMLTSNLNIEDNGQTASATMCWFRSSAGQRGTFRLQCHFFAKVTGPTVWETPSDPSQPTTRYAAKVSARIYVDRQPNSGGTLERVMTIKDVTIDSDTVTSSTGVTVDEDINVQIPYDPNYRYRIQYEASVSYNGGKIAPRPQAMASLTGINSSTSYQISAAAYMAALYAGGLRLSASTDDYFSVSYSAANGIETEMLNKNGYGLRVTSTGVQIKRGSSAAWTNL